MMSNEELAVNDDDGDDDDEDDDDDLNKGELRLLKSFSILLFKITHRNKYTYMHYLIVIPYFTCLKIIFEKKKSLPEN